MTQHQIEYYAEFITIFKNANGRCWRTRFINLAEDSNYNIHIYRRIRNLFGYECLKKIKKNHNVKDVEKILTSSLKVA